MKTKSIVIAGALALATYYALKTIIYMATREFKYFSFSEFDSPGKKGSGKENMSVEFINKLDILREKVGRPFSINSGFRTPEHNTSVGGATNSAHLRGHAADISVWSWTEAQKRKLITEALALGIRRIGWANSFIHLDDDPSRNNALWTYSGASIPEDIQNQYNLA